MHDRPRLFFALFFTLTPLLAFGCSSGNETAGTGGGSGTGGSTELPPVGGDERPVEVYVPSSYQEGAPTPLVILLHGYGAGGAVQDIYLGLKPIAESRGFLYAHPDGTPDADGKRFWNAADACCNFGDIDVDDSAYLKRVVDDIKARYTVDPKRVFFLGHSNGGFMSYRMACDHADTIAAIASLAGAMPMDTSKCQPSEPVAVLQIHGTADDTVLYGGGEIQGISYLSAMDSAKAWAGFDGCEMTTTPGADLDLESSIAGAETKTEAFGACQGNSRVELWSIEGGGHIPSLSPDFTTQMIDFLFAHPKP